MKKYYRMAVEHIKTGERDTYVSERQGAAPAGWKCTGICGCIELPDGQKYDFSRQTRKFLNKR